MTTASKTSKPEAVKFENFALDIARRREDAGNPEFPCNSGTRRTPSKRALLEAIAATGAKW